MWTTVEYAVAAVDDGELRLMSANGRGPWFATLEAAAESRVWAYRRDVELVIVSRTSEITVDSLSADSIEDAQKKRAEILAQNNKLKIFQ